MVGKKVLVSAVIYKTGSDLCERLSVATKPVNKKAQTHSDGRRLSISVKCSFHLTSRQGDNKNCLRLSRVNTNTRR